MKTASNYQHLQPEDRVTIASLCQQGLSIRAMARMLKRAPSTISREIARNAPGAAYTSKFAQQRCERRRHFARPVPKLHVDGPLFPIVISRLKLFWSPEQIALWLAQRYPEDHTHCVSHETIYNAIYAQPRGELRKDLIACLRHERVTRVPRTRGTDRRGQIPDMLSIHVRPPEVEDRLFPGHWEGDLIKGAANASAVGSLVERTSRFLILVKLPHPKPSSSAHVLQAFTDKLNAIAQPMRQTLTYDRGREMMQHKQLSENTGIKVYFCDPYSPWQRGTNENTNGLVRQYLPKGTDLSGYSQEQLDAIADQINMRPRKTLGVRCPLEVYRECLLNASLQSNTIH